jgi:GntR family transcriptional regulator
MNLFELISIDKRQNTSLRVQFMNKLRLAIYDYALPENMILPTSQEISKHLLLSKEDVEHALNTLEQEGLLGFTKKNQYFISHKKQTNEFIAKAFLLFQYIKKLGLVPSIETLEQRLILADEKLAKKMNVSIGDKIMFLKRIYYGDKKPMVLIESYLCIALFPNAETMIFTNQPHFEVLTKLNEIEPYRSVRENRVISLNAFQAKALKDMEGAPCHQVEVWTYEKGGRLTDYNSATLPSSDVFETETLFSLIQPIL